MLSALLLFLLAVDVSSTVFDPDAQQRKDAFTGVGAPVSAIAVPTLSNVSSLHPNSTFVIPNGTTAVESSGAFDYAHALTLPWQYLKAARLGRLPADNGIPWRADSFLADPVPNGYADAGDHILANLPLGQSLTLLALSIVEFGEGYSSAGATADALDALRWGTDFLVASRTSDVVTVAQVGMSYVDHGTWLPAEQSAAAEGTRPAYSVSPAVTGSDVQASMAGALAAASIVFSDEDAGYARHLLANARDLYALAKAFPGTYNSLSDAAAIYPSSGYLDDLAFASALLYYRTNESQYLDDSRRFYSQLSGINTYSFSWDNKQAGAALYLGLLLPAPANQPFLRAVSSYLDSWSAGKNGVVKTFKVRSFSVRQAVNTSNSSSFGKTMHSL